MKHRRCVEQFVVDGEPALLAREGAKEVDAARMVEEKIGFGIPDELGNSAPQLCVGHLDAIYAERGKFGFGHRFHSFGGDPAAQLKLRRLLKAHRTCCGA